MKPNQSLQILGWSWPITALADLFLGVPLSLLPTKGVPQNTKDKRAMILTSAHRVKPFVGGVSSTMNCICFERTAKSTSAAKSLIAENKWLVTGEKFLIDDWAQALPEANTAHHKLCLFVTR